VRAAGLDDLTRPAAIQGGFLMLILSRRKGEDIVFSDEIVLTVIEVGEQRVRLGIRAPEKVLALRQELAEFKTDPSVSMVEAKEVELSPYERFATS
jgi:carbon storage regulator